MATEPIALFAEKKNPALVIAVLRKMNALYTMVGTEDAWSEIVVTHGGRLTNNQLRITHDPDYYSGPGWQLQMNGMRGYFSRFPEAPEQAQVLALTEKFGFALGTICDPDAEPGDERYAVLSAIAEALDAVWFTPSAMRDAHGRVLYGVAERDPEARWPAYTPILPAPDSVKNQQLALKQGVFGELASLGFQPAESLPLPDLDVRTRDAHEVCTRLMALQAVFAWAAMPEHVGATALLQGYIERNNLRASMTESERALINLPRQQSQSLYADTVGWRLENMWALAWIAGFEPVPALDASQISDEVIEAMLFDFLPAWADNAADFSAGVSLRPASEVIYMEYKFYCAHNAVRSAQLGGATVPAGFDPVMHGGAVHERRHSLTWALAPEDDWDDTDLST
ncbi:DUF4272 domain-containing protein [Massilia pseudoviolaceinigra]|uniref:DUF4272 domain-containing protein n=1 Tax=Massilia pseudoviolaceinigra TaxID=3057165 RepID=UPI0027967D98|nr:DUF4272 domain-containing protein [Massilia sp. CCM 9206]MDQ1920353.1 DUF4272 domain-containing protein [Massilia sp. CCM 9206]